MSVSAKLRELLDHHHVKYSICIHSRAYTAQELAALMHVPGKEMAKVVIIKLDGQFAMAVMPAPDQIDFERLKAITGTRRVELASESEFQGLFPDCEIGAMPPFGNLYNLPVYVEEALTKDQEIVFNAGSHTDAVRMPYEDYARLANPTVLSYTYTPK